MTSTLRAKLLPPGSIAWLLFYELKLTFRNSSRSSRIGVGVATAIVLVLMAVAGIPTAMALRRFEIPMTPIVVFTFDLGLGLLFTLLLSQTLASATMAFYERGDLDLLLSSPLPARRVLAVRALAIAAAPFMVFASLVTPFLVPLAFLGHSAWLAAYGVLAALALAATAIGLIVAMALFRAIGPRRTRTIGQILAGFIGAAFFLLTQSRNLFPHNGSWVFANLQTLTRSSGITGQSLFAWPARALLGDPLPFAALAAAAIALFSASSLILGARFAFNASLSLGAERPRDNSRFRIGPLRFRSGVMRTLVRKELFLLARDPALLSQVLLRVLYLIPLLFVLLRNAASHLDSAVVTGSGALTFVASQVAASLAWITMSAEDAPDLLTSAPIQRATVQQAKLIAVLMPIAALLFLPIATLAWFLPRAAVAAFLGVAGASISSCLINLWYEKPAQRKNFRRRSSGSFAATIAELVVGIGWSSTVVAAAAGTLWSLLLLALTIGLLAAFSMGRNRPA
jgi:ABC-2 type transport system permease protein